jgi:hypothetical protein
MLKQILREIPRVMTLSSNHQPNPLSDFRCLVDKRPDAFYWDVRRLARILRCSEFEAEEARRWVLEDGLEVCS